MADAHEGRPTPSRTPFHPCIDINVSKVRNRPLGRTSDWHMQQLSARIQSRCCGLVEVSQDQHIGTDPAHAFIVRRIKYMHLTVAEFLTFDDVSPEVQKSTKPVTGLISALMAGCLSTMKISPPSSLRPLVHYNVDILVRLYRTMSSQNQDPFNIHVDSLDTVLTSFRKARIAGRRTGLKSSEHWSDTFGYVASQSLLNPARFDWQGRQGRSSIYTFAARWGLTSYLKSRCPRQFLRDPTPVTLALETWPPNQGASDFGLGMAAFVSICDQRETLIFLLQHLAVPEKRGLEQLLFNFARKYASSRTLTSQMFGNQVVACVLAPELLLGGRTSSGRCGRTATHVPRP